MKRLKFEKKFLEELVEVPIVSSACKKLGLSRNTIYQWRKKYPEFKKEMNRALELGLKSGNDLAESQLLKAVQQGQQWAIKFWLRNNKRNYIKPKPRDFWDFSDDT